MKRAHACMGALAIVATMVGCSSHEDPFGPEPDFGSIEQKLARPTGTLAPGKEATLFGEYASRRAGSNDLDVSGTKASAPSDTAAGGVRSQALDWLDAGMGSPSSVGCNDLRYGRAVGSCACPGGGDFAYDFSGAQQARRGGPINATLKVRFNACSSKAGSIDGREFVRVRSSSGLSAKDLFLILSLDVTLTAATQSHHLAADLVYESGAYWLSVDVDDGHVVVSGSGSAKDGSFTVRDRNTTWTCKLTGGKGSCTSTAGETREVQ